MSPSLRRLALTAHIVSSVGWLGSVAGVLALAVAGWTSEDDRVVRGAYLAMDLTAWSVLLPLALASLLTGLLQALGTPWGLFRHYWVVIKLVITVVATGVLLLYMRTLDGLAGIASTTTDDHLGVLRTPSVVLHAGGALALLLVATVLGVYKPRGRTRYGRRKASVTAEL